MAGLQFTRGMMLSNLETSFLFFFQLVCSHDPHDRLMPYFFERKNCSCPTAWCTKFCKQRWNSELTAIKVCPLSEIAEAIEATG